VYYKYYGITQRAPSRAESAGGARCMESSVEACRTQFTMGLSVANKLFSRYTIRAS
jgi:hypothetical protein